MRVRAAAPVVVAAALLLAGCGGGAQAHWRNAERPGGQTPSPERVNVALEDAGGAEVGRAKLVQTESGVEIKATFEGSPGYRGFHIHENGVCDADDPEGPFASAGGHYAPDDGDHPQHAGDLPSLLVTADGTAELTVVTDRVTLDELVDPGTALMVHTDPDNYGNIPERYHDGEGVDEETANTGDAGDRDACGVIGESG